MKKVIIITICLVLLIAVGLSTVLVLGLTGKLSISNFFSTDNFELVNRQEYSSSELENLNVAYASGRLTLLPATGEDIVIEEYMSHREDDRMANIDNQGDTLTVTAGHRPTISFFSVWRSEIRVYVPSLWLGNVVLENSSGSIRSEGDFSFNTFSAHNKSGSVKLGNIGTEGDINITSSSGSISGNRLTAGGNIILQNKSASIKLAELEGKEIDINGSSGSIKCESAEAEKIRATNKSSSIWFGNIEGEFALKSSSGSIKIEGGRGSGRAENSSSSIEIALQEMTGDIYMKNNSGGCRLYVPRDAQFHFIAKTTSSSVKTPDDASWNHYVEKDNDEVSGTLGDDAEYTVEMYTSSASIKLEWL